MSERSMSRLEFANHIGRAASYITQLANEGRLVMTADGRRILVNASARLIANTAGARPDVADRHAAERSAKQGSPKRSAVGDDDDDSSETPEGMEEVGNTLQAARALKERYLAKRAKVEYETLIGGLIARDDVEAALRFVGGAMRSEMEVFPDQMAATLAALTNIDDVHATLTDACTNVLLRICAECERRQKELSIPADSSTRC